MSQHFRATPAARSITIADVMNMTDREITRRFLIARWGSEKKQGCPHCGQFDCHYERRPQRRTSRRPATRRTSPSKPQWRCRACFEIFSITSGTLFDASKLPLRLILLGIVLALGPANGAASLVQSSHLGVAPKTAWIFGQRLREAMAADGPTEKFTGFVQMDGGYFCGKPYKPNRRLRVSKEQLQRRYGKAPLTPSSKPWVEMGMTYRNYVKRRNKRVVLAVTHSDGPVGHGAQQVAVLISRSEGERAIGILAVRHIAPGATVMTDEAGPYNAALAKDYGHLSVCHSKEYSTADGVNDNHCEAFFSRLRRAEYGVFHGMRTPYLDLYAGEAAWRHNHRRDPKVEQVTRMLQRCLTMKPSPRFRGYFAARGKRVEVLV
jgi:hypothetical protein